MIKLTNEKLQAIVEQSGDDGNFYSLTNSKEIADIYGSDTSTISADSLVNVVFGIMEEIIECQDNDRDLRLKLARNYVAQISGSACLELESSWDQAKGQFSPDKKNTSAESWESLNDVGLIFQGLLEATFIIDQYCYLEDFSYFFSKFGGIDCIEEEEFFTRVYLNHVIYKRNNIQVTDINDHFDIVERDEDVLGKNPKAIK